MITRELVMERTVKRFWSKIKFDEPDKCWEWQAYRHSQGYGRFGIVDGIKHKLMLAHRFLFKSIYGAIDERLKVCHTCDNPSCCNPNHFFLGTQQDNVTDRVLKGRSNSVKGSSQGFSKLTEDQVFSIKKRLANEETTVSIAKDFNVFHGTISRIKLGKAWKHVIIDEDIPQRRICKSKLTKDQVILIKMRLSVGESQKSISNAMSIKHGLVWTIASGKNWKHVTI